jgi:hypothetical protein
VAKKKRKHQHKRIWLDPSNPDSQAWASWKICSYHDEGEMDIQIADCYRSISLTLYNKRDERKIRKLIKFLEDAVQKHAEERDA